MVFYFRRSGIIKFQDLGPNLREPKIQAAATVVTFVFSWLAGWRAGHRREPKIQAAAPIETFVPSWRAGWLAGLAGWTGWLSGWLAVWLAGWA